MIEINLLPDDLKKAQSRHDVLDRARLNLPEIPMVKIGAVLIVVLLGVHVIITTVGLYGKLRSGSLTKKQTKLVSDKKEVASLKTESAALIKKTGVINELMVKRFSWAKKLNAMGDSVTPGVWLSELVYDERMEPGAKDGKAAAGHRAVNMALERYLVLTGYASSLGEQGTALVAKFIKALKENPDFYSDFSSIELDSIKTEKLEAQEVMSFKITCRFKEAR